MLSRLRSRASSPSAKTTRDCALLFLIGFLPRLILTFSSFPAVWPDSAKYIESAFRMSLHGDFHTHAIYRTPLYSIFISVFFSLVGDDRLAGIYLIAAQRLLGIASGYLVYAIGRKLFPNTLVAFFGAALFLIAPRELYYETMVLTEVLFSFLLLLGVLLLLNLYELSAVESCKIHKFVWLGFVFGLLTLTRPIAQFLLPALLLTLIFKSQFRRKILAGSATALVALAITVAPWIYINHAHYDFWGVSRDFGLNLYHRVIDIDGAEPRPLAESTFTQARKIYEKVRQRPGVTYFSMYFTLLKKDHSDLEADEEMAGFAFETLKHDPSHFIPNTVEHFSEFFLNPRISVMLCRIGRAPTFICSSLQNESHPNSFPDFPNHLSIFGRKCVVFWFKVLTFPEWLVGSLTLFGIGLYFIERSFARSTAFPIIVIVGYFATITAVFNRAEDRFRIPVDGFFWLIATAALFFLIIHLKKSLSALFCDNNFIAKGLTRIRRRTYCPRVAK